MWELDHKESCTPKNWCFWTVVLEKTLESPLDCKEIQPVHCKGNQSWIFIARADAEAETLILWLSDAKNWLLGKDSDAGKDWRQEEKGTAEDEIVGWHHQLNGHEFLQAPGACDRQGNLACCSTWGHSQTWLSDGTELKYYETVTYFFPINKILHLSLSKDSHQNFSGCINTSYAAIFPLVYNSVGIAMCLFQFPSDHSNHLPFQSSTRRTGTRPSSKMRMLLTHVLEASWLSKRDSSTQF